MMKQRALSLILLVTMLVSMISPSVLAAESSEAMAEPAAVETTVEPEAAAEDQSTQTDSGESQTLTTPAEVPAETPEASTTPEETPAEDPAATELPAETGETDAEESVAEEAAEEPAAEEGVEEVASDVEAIIPEETAGEDADTLAAGGPGSGQTESIYDHSFGHIDLRIYENTVTLNKYYINENNEKVYIGTETVNATVSKIYYATLDGVTYSNFTSYGSGEYREYVNPGVKITTNSTAVFEVDLTANGTTYKNVVATFSYAGIEDAAYNCNGYLSRGKFDGLDFRIDEGDYVTFDVEVYEREVSVEKVWDDSDDLDGLRPSGVTVNLLSNGSVADTIVLNEGNNWFYEFTGLPTKDSSGKGIAYTVQEVVPDGYTPLISGNAADGYVITNSHTPVTITISGIKKWDDVDDKDGLRPKDVTIELYANDVKVHEMDTSADKSWAWSFTVPKYSGGEEIVYTVKEEAVEGYTSKVTGSVEDGYVITNTHVPEEVAISGSKTWDDADDQDGKRPDSIYVSLYADSVKNGVVDGELIAKKKVSSAENWSWDFGKLPKYKNGVEIYYYVVESAVNEGELSAYSTEVSGYNIINRYTPETVTVAGSKSWWDNDDQDGKRPDSITIALYADYSDGKGPVKIAEKTVTAEDDWAGSWTGLPKYKNGTEIIYSVDELNVPDGYTKVVDGYNIRNVHTPETISISGVKKWEDENNQDSLRPNYIQINLMRQVGDGEIEKVDDVWAYSTTNWAWSFDDLPQYEGGQFITYSIEEIQVDGYTTAITGSVKDGFTITNTHEPATIDIPVEKVWKDEDDQDGKRPDSITITLLADGAETGKTLTLNAENEWKDTFEDLPVYSSGNKITYTIDELNPRVYTSVITGSEAEGFIVTNTYEPETREITVTKVWDDNNDQDGYRPEYIEVQLYAGVDKVGEAVKIYGSGSYTFKNLPVYDKGVEIEYSVTETMPENGDEYTQNIDYSELADGAITITNKHEPETTTLKITKEWVIPDGYDSYDTTIPNYIVLYLYGNNRNLHTYYNPDAEASALSKYKVKVEPTVKNGTVVWEYEWTGLAKYYNNGSAVSEVEYTVFEENMGDWNPSYKRVSATEIAITNTFDPEHTFMSVSKLWWDYNDQDGVRPDYLAVDLMVIKTNVKDEDDVLGPSKVETVYLGDVAGSTVSVNGEDKTIIYGSWEYVWPQLDRYETIDSKEYRLEYYVKEVVPEGYTLNIPDGYIVSSSNDKQKTNGEQSAIYNDTLNKWTLVNVHTPETTEVEVTKEWKDKDDAAGFRPESITVKLLANNTDTGKTLVLNEENDWTGTFEALAKYSNAKLINYTVEEVDVAHYTSEITGNAADGYTITNTHEPEVTSIAVTKVWNDDSNRDGLRPESIELQLKANGDDYGDPVEVDSDDDWTYTFTDLPVYQNGQKIVYTVEEAAVAGYTSSVSDISNGKITVTNTHEIERVRLSGKKVWDDGNNQDGIRPTSVTIEIYADVFFNTGDPIKVRELTVNAFTADSTGNEWSWEVTGLPKHYGGEAIEYTVKEKIVASGYEVEYSNTGYSYTVTNTHKPVTIKISGTKVWEDANDQDGKRPEAITIQLWKEIPGNVGDDTKIKEVTVDKDGNWSFDFGEWPLYEEGKRIDYYIVESGVSATSASGVSARSLNDYSTVIYSEYKDKDNDGNPEEKNYIVTNIYTPETVIVAGTKEWNDANDQDGIRPEKITIYLYADGIKIREMEIGADQYGNWGGVFGLEDGSLPRYKDGKEIVYTIGEKPVEGYTTAVHGFNIVNTHIPETFDIEGTKTWDDGENQDGIRPHNIVITLMGKYEGVEPYEVAEEWVSLEGDNWYWLFENLPVYQNGKKVEYYIEEDTITGYTPTIDTIAVEDGVGTINITNTHTPEVIDISGEKTWDDADDQDGKRPESITINLLANGEKVATKTVTAEDGWKWTFAGVDKYADGKEIVYTISEEAVDGYTATYDGADVTNTHKPETTFVHAIKLWNDDDNRDAMRPESITVKLLADGKDTGKTLVLNEENKWNGYFNELPVYAAGEKIVYTLVEAEVQGYVASYTATAEGKIITITNTHESETKAISVKKVWNDGDDADGLRPETVKVQLLANGEKVGAAVELVDGAYTFKNLAKHQDGKEIVYTVEEIAVDGYEASYETSADGSTITITNTHEVETTEITVKKLWKDNDDADGIRPESVKIQLLADGEKVGEAVEVKDTYTWTDLPVNKAGKAITYTVEEVDVPDGYEPKYSELKAGVITITNVHEQETTEIKVTKTWVDNNDAKKARPKNITVQLYANGVAYGAAVTITEDMKWEYTFSDLPANKNGKPIEYTVKEAGVKHYIAKYTVGNNNVLVIKNTYTAIPLTGDTINMLLWSIIGGSAMLSLGGVTVLAKKKKFVK